MEKKTRLTWLTYLGSSHPFLNVLVKYKHHRNIKSFVQTTKGSAKDILRIKEVFSKLSTRKIIEIHNVAHRRYVPRST